jgi:hypothetical protein
LPRWPAASILARFTRPQRAELLRWAAEAFRVRLSRAAPPGRGGGEVGTMATPRPSLSAASIPPRSAASPDR